MFKSGRLTARSGALLGLLVTLGATGCSSGGGGGGGGGGPGSGSGSGSTGRFTLKTNQLQLQPRMESYLAPEATLLGSITGVSGQVYLVVAHTNAGIAHVGVDVLSDTTGQLRIQGRERCSLAPGRITDTITVYACLDQDCKRQIDGSPQTVQVVYDNASPIMFAHDTVNISGAAGAMGSDNNNSVAIESCGGEWTVASDQAWLEILERYGNGVSYKVRNDLLPPGNHQGRLTFRDTATGASKDLNVNVDLHPPHFSGGWTNGETAAEWFGEDAQDFAQDPRTLGLSYGVGFPLRPITWQLSDATPAWLIGPRSGTLGASPGEGAIIPFHVDVAAIPGNVDQGFAELVADLNGYPLMLAPSVRVYRLPQRLRPETPAVAFALVQGEQRLTAEVNLHSSAQQPAEWHAAVTHDDPNHHWLTATTNGSIDLPLALTADPAGLADGQTYYATVVIQSAGFSSTQVRVGLYVDRSVSPVSLAQFEPTGDEFTPRYSRLIADPLRPLVYYSNFDDTITAVNIYSGQMEFQLAGLGGDVRALAISDDARYLYALDHADQSIARVDLLTRAPLPALTPEIFRACPDCGRSGNYANNLVFTRVNDVAVLVTGLGQIISPSSGASFFSHSAGFPEATSVVVAGNGKVALLQNESYTHRLGMKTRAATGQWAVAVQQSFANYNHETRLDSNFDASEVIVGCDHEQKAVAIDDYRLSFPPRLSPFRSDVGRWIDRTKVACFNTRYYDRPDVYVIDRETAEILTPVSLDGDIKPENHAVSGDKNRLIVRLKQSGQLHFIDL